MQKIVSWIMSKLQDKRIDFLEKELRYAVFQRDEAERQLSTANDRIEYLEKSTTEQELIKLRSECRSRFVGNMELSADIIELEGLIKHLTSCAESICLINDWDMKQSSPAITDLVEAVSAAKQYWEYDE